MDVSKSKETGVKTCVIARTSVNYDYLGLLDTRLRENAIETSDRAMVAVSTGNHDRDFRDFRRNNLISRIFHSIRPFVVKANTARIRTSVKHRCTLPGLTLYIIGESVRCNTPDELRQMDDRPGSLLRLQYSLYS